MTDVFKKSFLDNYTAQDLGTIEIVVILLAITMLGIYVYFIYKIKTRNEFYSKDFSISLIAVALITGAIILTIQQSIVASLGMVGALSIVRFRTAVKNPMDLVFLFWSIAIGIICGVGLIEVALILSVVVTIVIYVFSYIPTLKDSIVVTIDYKKIDKTDKEVYEVLGQHCRRYSVRARNIVNDHIDLVVEVRVKDSKRLSNDLSELNDVYSVSLMRYDDSSSAI